MSLNNRSLALLASLVVCAATLGAAGTAQLKVGDSFPDLTQFKFEGQLPAALKGKVVIVDFWASWCSPCKASFPVLEELHQQYADKGVVVLAVNLDDKPAAMQEFLKLHKASFPIVRDAAKKLVAQVNISTMPTSFVLDGEGKVRAIHNGFHGDKTKQEYQREIAELLK